MSPYNSQNDEIAAAYQQLSATEELLTYSVKKYESLLQNMTDIFWVSDLEGKILFINDVCYSILGYNKEQMTGKYLYQFMCPLHQYASGTCIKLVAEMAIRDFASETLWMLHSDGKTRKVLEVNTMRLSFDQGGAEIQGVARDVTDRIRLERKVNLRNKQLVLLNEVMKMITDELLLKSPKMLFTTICKRLYDALQLVSITLKFDEEEWPIAQFGKEKTSNCLEPIVVPIYQKGVKVGAIKACVDCEAEEETIGLLNTVAAQFSVVLEKNQMYADRLELNFRVIESFVAAIEAKDIYTQGHSVRVSQYALEIGMYFGLSSEKMEVLRFASVLHDVGKIGISDTILTQSGKLTPEEYQMIKQHPIIGKKILEPLGLSGEVLNTVLFHHKRFDKKGYPELIEPLEDAFLSDIICVADAYDAMTSNRSYKATMSLVEVLEELLKNKGTQFNPAVVDAIIYTRRIRP